MKFAINTHLLNHFDARKEAKRVTTKKWSKQYIARLAPFADRLGTHGVVLSTVVHSILIEGYGFNIAQQILARLSSGQLLKIRENILGEIK